MDAEKAHYPITKMADLLDVSRSGFYDWAGRQATPPGPGQHPRAQQNH